MPAFEEVIFLLWNGTLPKQAELEQLKKDLAAHRATSPARDRFPGRLRQVVSHGCAAHRRLHAEPGRSRGAGHVHRGQRAQGPQADVADGHHRHHLRPPAQRQAGDRERPQPRLLRQLPLYADRQAARRGHGARVRRRHDPACRPRTERLHLRRARHRRHACRISTPPSPRRSAR